MQETQKEGVESQHHALDEMMRCTSSLPVCDGGVLQSRPVPRKPTDKIYQALIILISESLKTIIVISLL